MPALILPVSSIRPQQLPLSSANNPKKGGNVRFGNHDLVNKFVQSAIPVSKAATEVYLISFFYQDVLCVWMPRTGISLKTGRTPYDSDQDPDAQNLSWPERKMRSIRKNLEGLNWVNFSEESKRETATGPGTLVVPAGIFLANRYLGNISRELSFKALQNFSGGFKASLIKEAHTHSTLNQQEYQKAVGYYISGLFADPQLRRQQAPFLRNWGQRYAAAMFEEAEKPSWQRIKESVTQFWTSKRYKTPLDLLAQELKDVIIPFNREHRILAYVDSQNPFIHDNKPLHRLEYSWIDYIHHHPKGSNMGKGNLQQVSLGHLLGDLSRSGGYFKKVWKDTCAQRGESVPTEQLALNAEKTMKRLVSSKFILGMSVTILTVLYLLRLAFWSQSSDKYQATRLLRQKYNGMETRHE